MAKFVKYGMLCVLVMVLVAGCATGTKKSDEQLVGDQVLVVKKALEAKDIEMLFAVVSEDFDHPEVGGKAELKALAEAGLDSGYADDGTCDLKNMQLTKKSDGTIAVYPIDLSSPAGSVSVELVFKKDKDNAWRLLTGNADGV
jgi:ketosteroid isomerase-like protein